MFKDEYDDDELPAIEVNATIQDSSLEMPSARELATRRARELSVQRALAAPDAALLCGLEQLQVATPPQSQPRSSAPSLSVALLTNITPDEDTKELHNKIIDVMKMDSHRLRDPVLYSIYWCLCSCPPQLPLPWSLLVLWSLAAGEGGGQARRALHDCLGTHGGDIDMQSICSIMCDAVQCVEREVHPLVWERVWGAARGHPPAAGGILRRGLAILLHSPDLALGSGPLSEAELVSAVQSCRLSPSGRLAALALCGRALANKGERGTTTEESVNSDRHRLLLALEGQTGDKQQQHHHECAVSARRLRLLFQRAE